MFLARIEEIYVQPDQPETLLPSQSIRHETKVRANDFQLLQNERTIDDDDDNNLENRNDKNNYEFTRMIANGILAAEALEKSLVNKTASGDSLLLKNYHKDSSDSNESPHIFLMPPRTLERPFRFEGRPPLIEGRPSLNDGRPSFNDGRPPQNDGRLPLSEGRPPLGESRYALNENRSPFAEGRYPVREHSYILPGNRAGNRFKSYNPPIRKPMPDRPKVTKISMPPIRRDYITNLKSVPQFPVQNQPWSLQRHFAMRGPSAPYPSKHKFSGPIKITKKEFAIPAKNVGFQPDSVVVESGFTPIMRQQYINDRENETDFPDSTEADYPEQSQRRSDKADVRDEHDEDGDNTELLIKTFEPMFIPSPLDSASVSAAKTPSKRLSGDLQYMEVEDGEDKVALAGERHAYYLPPDTGKPKTTKLYPAGTVVTYDGRTVLDKSLLDSEPNFPTPHRPGSLISSISSTEQLLHLPQFGPFHGEIPPLTPELMKPSIVRSPQRAT